MRQPTRKEKIERVKKTPQQTLYIPPARAEEWIEMKEDLGEGIGQEILDMYREYKKLKNRSL